MEKLSLDRLGELLSYDASTGLLTWLPRPATDFASPDWGTRWKRKFEGQVAGSIGSGSLGYVVISVSGCWHLGHRIAWGFHYGDWPIGQIDHINGDRADNRIANLRDVPAIINARNCSLWKTNKSGASGVFFVASTGRWRAAIGCGTGAHIGMFDTKDEAIAARKAAEVRLGYHPNHGRAA